MTKNYLQQAFNQVCQNAKQPEYWYVTLIEETSFYGGPEEGGWWGHDTHIVAYQTFPTEEMAKAAYDQVLMLAQELQQEAQNAYGRQCLKELEWLEARGLDADFLPDPDGPSNFRVVLSQTLPEEKRGSRQWD